MPDVTIRVPAEIRDRLARRAASQGVSLRRYLSHLAGTLVFPEGRVMCAEELAAALREWTTYNWSECEAAELDTELDRRIREAGFP